jgi:hypothetical protein
MTTEQELFTDDAALPKIENSGKKNTVKKQSKKKKDIMEILSEEFDESDVKKRKLTRSNGDIIELDYVPGSNIIQRLNNAFGLSWSFQVIDKIIDMQAMQIAICGRIIVGNKTTEQWGGTFISRNMKGGIISLGDDLKIATTDALKKCATHLGVGLYLYDSDSSATVIGNIFNQPVDDTTVENMKQTISNQSQSKPNDNSSSEDNNLCTKMQIKAISKVCKHNNISESTLISKLGVSDIKNVKYNDAASIIIMEHPVWKEIKK